MRIRAINPQTGSTLSESITGVNFGNIRQGEHCASPVVVQPITTSEDEFDDMVLYLQNNGGYNQSQFGYRVSSTFTSDVRSYSVGVTGPVISDHFTLVSDASGSGGVNIELSDFIWLDVQVGATETGSTSNVNYRFTFEYS